jgi:hypothetical protein
MKRTEKWLPASEALVIHRVLARIDQKALEALREGRDADGLAMARLSGQLQVRAFQVDENDMYWPMTTVFDAMREEFDFDSEAA